MAFSAAPPTGPGAGRPPHTHSISTTTGARGQSPARANGVGGARGAGYNPVRPGGTARTLYPLDADPMATDWFYTLNGEQAPAPATAEQLRQLAASGQLLPTDMVWREGMTGWAPASSIKGLFAPARAPDPMADKVAPAGG